MLVISSDGIDRSRKYVVEVTWNGVEYSTGGAAIVEPPLLALPGTFHSAGFSSPGFHCPAGSFCPEASTRNFTLCPQGTY